MKPILTEAEKKEAARLRQIKKEEALERKRLAAEKEAAILASILEDRPPGFNPTGERGLISAIFVQCLNDMLKCPHPDLSKEDTYKKDSPESDSIDAARFINANNEVFCAYCELLDIEPHYMEKSFFAFFKKQLEKKRLAALQKPKASKKIDEVTICNANIVTILTHLLSELLVMITATQYYVAANVRDAA